MLRKVSKVKVAIAGATGTMGRLVAQQALGAGHEVVSLARAEGIDLRRGDDLESRLSGVEVVIDVLNVATQRRSVAEQFFSETTRTLQRAEAAAGVAHHVLSIVGCERVASGYYFGKQAQKRRSRRGQCRGRSFAPLSGTSSQQVLGFFSVGPFSGVPSMRVQPVAAVEVAALLVELAGGAPRRELVELAGPLQAELVDLARAVNERSGLGRRLLPFTVPGAAGKAMRSGALLPTGPGMRGQQTFDEWLAQRTGH